MRSYQTKRIALPGGKFIEIVVFGDEGPEAVEPTAPEQDSAVAIATEQEEDQQVDLHVCPECSSDLVYPVGWEERRGDSWEITLRCPNCEWWHTDEYQDEEVERFDDVLNDGTEELLATLRTFARANMEEDVERLIEAIDSGLIQPMDF
jgi:hypothetical protein